MKTKGTIYVLESSLGHYKIGCSSKLAHRITMFGVKLPFTVSLLVAIEVDDMYHYEAWLHNIFAKNRVNGEWFILDYISLKLIVEYLKTQQSLDEFIDWFQKNQSQITVLENEGITPAASYYYEKETVFLPDGSTEHITTRQIEIDKAANEIWGITPWDS